MPSTNDYEIHRQGKIQFADIPEIVGSTDALSMGFIMWRFIEGDLQGECSEETRLRMLSFALENHLKKPHSFSRPIRVKRK